MKARAKFVFSCCQTVCPIIPEEGFGILLAAPTHLSLAKGAAQVELVTQAMWPALIHFFSKVSFS